MKKFIVIIMTIIALIALTLGIDMKLKETTVVGTIGGLVIAGATFPFYNWNKHYSVALTGINLWLNIACHIELGILERRLLTNCKTGKIALLNLGIVISGMGCRYLLEYGEVSNTYNFTIPNIVFHIVVTLGISIISYFY